MLEAERAARQIEEGHRLGAAGFVGKSAPTEDLLRAVRQRRPYAARIMLTGHADATFS